MACNKTNDDEGGTFPIPDGENRAVLSTFGDEAIVLGIKLAYTDTGGSKADVEEAIAFFAWELIRRVRLRPDSAKGTTDAAPTR